MMTAPRTITVTWPRRRIEQGPVSLRRLCNIPSSAIDVSDVVSAGLGCCGRR